MKWYPEKLKVGTSGTPPTYQFMSTVFNENEQFHYAEFGIYKGETALKVHELFPKCEIHLFDYENILTEFKTRVSKGANRFHYYGNTQKYHDSYNWALMKLEEANPNKQIFDYCFLDGAHTVAIDTLNFLLVDRLLRTGGYVDFDDYGWKLRGSSLDPKLVPEIAEQYTDEQIDTRQVKMIVETLVRPDNRYLELVPNKIFRKSLPQSKAKKLSNRGKMSSLHLMDQAKRKIRKRFRRRK